MIPPFGSNGLLQPTEGDVPYECTVDEVRERLVVEPGGQAWRSELFESWELLFLAVRNVVPSARWWLWGNLVSNHPEPLFGPHQTVDAATLLPAGDLPTTGPELTMLVDFLRTAHLRHRVDVTTVFLFAPDDPRHLSGVAVLEEARARAARNIADYESKLLIPAGFVEVMS